jgi:proteasome activator subunit 4
MKFSWHEPSEREIDIASSIMNEFLGEIFERVKGFANSISLGSKPKHTTVEIKHTLVFLNYLLRGGSNILHEPTEDIIEGYARYQSTRVITSGMIHGAKNLKYGFKDIGETCHLLIKGLIASEKNYLDVLEIIPKNLTLVFCLRGGVSRPPFVKVSAAFRYVKSTFYSMDPNYGKYPRTLLIERIILELGQRYAIYADSLPYTKLHKTLLTDLIDLSLSPYSIIRKKAQTAFTHCVKRFPLKITRELMPPIINTLSDSKATEAERTGAIYLLERQLSRVIVVDWDFLLSTILALCRTYHVEKQSIQDRLMEFYEILYATYYQLPRQDPKRVEEFIKQIFSIIENNPSLHWKYRLMIGSFIVFLVRSDNLSPPIRVVEWMIQNLVSDIDKLRGLAFDAINLILCHYKPIQPVRSINTQNISLSKYWNNWKPIQNQSEWEKTDIIDKNYYGWNLCLPETLVPDYKKTPVDHSEDILHLALKKEFLQEIIDLYVIREDAFNEINAQMWKGFIQIWKMDFFKMIQPMLNELLKQAGSAIREEIHYMTTSSEIMAGIVRGIKHWKWDDQQIVAEYFKTALSVLDTCSLNCIDEFSECIEFCVTDRDPRRIVWLRNILISKVETSLGRDSQQAKYLKYLYSYVNGVYWRDPETCQGIMKLLKNYLDFPYEQVREVISLHLSTCLKAFWSVARNDKNVILYKEDETKNAICDEFLNDLIDHFNKVNPHDEDAFNTHAKLMVSLVYNMYQTHFPFYGSSYTKSIIKIMILIQDLADEETQSLARGNLTLIATWPFSEKQTTELLFSLIDLAKETKTWKGKSTILQFFQIFGYYRQFYLRNHEKEVFELIVGLLCDAQFEVREAAAETLAGFFKISTQVYLDKYYAIFKQWTRKKEKDILKRYGGVLGISALIQAFPYEIPEFLPPILMEFASFSQESDGQIKDVVRKTFAEFWKLQGDTWQIEKKKFTEDQLSVIMDQMISPSYYA